MAFVSTPGNGVASGENVTAPSMQKLCLIHFQRPDANRPSQISDDTINARRPPFEQSQCFDEKEHV